MSKIRLHKSSVKLVVVRIYLVVSRIAARVFSITPQPLVTVLIPSEVASLSFSVTESGKKRD